MYFDKTNTKKGGVCVEKISLLCVVITIILNSICTHRGGNVSGCEYQGLNSTMLIVEEPIAPSKAVSEAENLNEQADYTDTDVDYGWLMAQAIANGDYWQAMLYNESLTEADNLNYDDLLLLSKIVDAEAGSSWLTEEQRLLVASVVINRVNSPEFPDTIHDVVYQKKQYAPAEKDWFDDLIPNESSVMAAYTILTEGSIAPIDVVYQANFKQGSGIYKSIHDDKLGTTYFCYSENRNLYK